jgi:hypothetical protein
VEERGSAGGPARRNWAARGPEVERAGGIGLGFALFFFKSISIQFQTFLDSNLLHLFKFQF